ncbi:MAG: hypothetical protein WDO69_08375 [Pseudomonadota bacterium]
MRTSPSGSGVIRDSNGPLPPSAHATDRASAVIVWGVFVLTFFKGFRFPSLWCATHFTFNYSQGFVRRGLIGEIARQIGGNYVYRYNTFVIFSFVLQWTAGILFALAAGRAFRQRTGDWNFRIALLVMCASPGMIFLVSAVGYFDFLGLISVLGLLLWVRKPRREYAIFYLLALLGSALALVHEGLIVMFGPTALFIASCHILRISETRALTGRQRALLGLHLLMAALVVTGTVVVASTPADPMRVKALQAFAEQHTDFFVRNDAFDVFTRTTRQNMFEAVPYFWSDSISRAVALRGEFGFAPSFFFLIYFGFRELRAASSRLVRNRLAYAFLFAAIAPESMNLVAWDWPRWNAMALATTGTCIVCYRLFFPAARQAARSLSFVTIGVLLTGIGLASTTMLFDRYEVQFFPFERQFLFIDNLIEGHFRFRPRS